MGLLTGHERGPRPGHTRGLSPRRFLAFHQDRTLDLRTHAPRTSRIPPGRRSSRCRGNDRYQPGTTDSRPPGAGAESEQRLAAGGGATRAWWPGGRGGLERGLDGIGDKLRGLRVDGDDAAEQHAADDLPGVPGCILRVGGHATVVSLHRDDQRRAAMSGALVSRLGTRACSLTMRIPTGDIWA